MSLLAWGLAALVVVLLARGWSRSLVGAVPRDPRTEAALAAAADAVAREFAATCGVDVEVQPVWAHGCPCLRITLPASLARSAPTALQQARSRSAALLQAAVRDNPDFGPKRGRYVGLEGLHWRTADDGA